MSAPICCGIEMQLDIYAGLPARRYCIDCGAWDGDGQPPLPAGERDGGEKGVWLGARVPQTRGARIIEEWDAAAYERENPL